MPTNDAGVTTDDLPDFDPRAYCEKCGNFSKSEVPDAGPKFGPKGGDGLPIQMPPAPPAPPPPPKTLYCNGTECPWESDNDPKTKPLATQEHMHQWCEVCDYEWLSKPLNAPRPDIEGDEEKKQAELEKQKIDIPPAPPAAAPATTPAKKAAPVKKPAAPK